MITGLSLSFYLSLHLLHLLVSGEEKVVSRGFLFLVLDRVLLVDARTIICGVAAERDVEHVEKRVHAWDERLWGVSSCLDTWLSIVDDDAVCKVCGHDKVVLHDEGGFLVINTKVNGWVSGQWGYKRPKKWELL